MYREYMSPCWKTKHSVDIYWLHYCMCMCVLGALDGWRSLAGRRFAPVISCLLVNALRGVLQSQTVTGSFKWCSAWIHSEVLEGLAVNAHFSPQGRPVVLEEGHLHHGNFTRKVQPAYCLSCLHEVLIRKLIFNPRPAPPQTSYGRINPRR